MEVMRKWDIDLTDDEERRVKKDFIGNQWILSKNPSSNSINVS